MKHNKEHIKKEILEELEDLNSSLPKILGDNPYRLPLNYYKELENDVVNKLKAKYPYKVGKEYFDNLADTIQERIKSEDNPPVHRIKGIKLISGIAASILLVASIFLLIPKNEAPLSPSLAEAELFLEENIADLDLEEMLELEISEKESNALELISPEALEIYIEENINEFNIEELSELL